MAQEQEVYVTDSVGNKRLMRVSEARKAIATGQYHAPDEVNMTMRSKSQIDPKNVDVDIDPRNVDIDPNDVEVDNPVKLGEPRKKGLLERWDESIINKPLTSYITDSEGNKVLDPHKLATAIDPGDSRDTNQDARLPYYLGGGTYRGLMGGLAEGAAGVGESFTSPLNLALMGASKLAEGPLAGYKALRNILEAGGQVETAALHRAARNAAIASTAQKVLAAPVAGTGAARITRGFEGGPEGKEGVDWGDIAHGTVEMAGGGAALAHGFVGAPETTIPRNPNNARPVGGSKTYSASRQGVSPAGLLEAGQSESAAGVKPQPEAPPPTGMPEIQGVEFKADGTAVIFDPSAQNTAILKSMGYIPSLTRSVAGFIQYVPAPSGIKTPTPSTPTTASSQQGQEIFPAEGEDVEIPQENLEKRPSIIENMLKNGYELAGVKDGKALFKKIVQDTEGALDINRLRELWGGLRAKLGREPTQEEVNQESLQKYGEEAGNVVPMGDRGQIDVNVNRPPGPTGRVADFPAWMFDPDAEVNKLPPIDLKKLQEFKNQNPWMSGTSPAAEGSVDPLAQRRRENSLAVIRNTTDLPQALENVQKWTALEAHWRQENDPEEWAHAQEMKAAAEEMVNQIRIQLNPEGNQPLGSVDPTGEFDTLNRLGPDALLERARQKLDQPTDANKLRQMIQLTENKKQRAIDRGDVQAARMAHDDLEVLKQELSRMEGRDSQGQIPRETLTPEITSGLQKWTDIIKQHEPGPHQHPNSPLYRPPGEGDEISVETPSGGRENLTLGSKVNQESLPDFLNRTRNLSLYEYRMLPKKLRRLYLSEYNLSIGKGPTVLNELQQIEPSLRQSNEPSPMSVEDNLKLIQKLKDQKFGRTPTVPQEQPGTILPFRAQNQLENISNVAQDPDAEYWYAKAREMGVNPEDFSSVGELAYALSEGDPNPYKRLEGESIPSGEGIIAPGDVDSNAALDDEINKFLRGEDGKPPEMTDLGDDDDEPRFARVKRPYEDLTPERHKRYHVYDENDNLIDKTYDHNEAQRLADEHDGYVQDVGEEEEGPKFARVKGGGLTASVDIKRAVENITKDYTSPLPAIQVREGVQNAGDAAEKLGANGEVRVRINPSNKSIEIHDNGSGLDEDALAHKLVEIFATGKEGEEGATGGKGIGSASYIYGGEFFSIDTTAVDRTDGTKYNIVASGTPEQFLDPVKGSDFEKTLVNTNTPTGTSIYVKLKDGQNITEAQKMIDMIANNSRNRQFRLVVDKFGMDPGMDVSEIEPTSDGFIKEYIFPASKLDKIIGDFTTTNRNSKVQVLVPKGNEGTRKHFDIHYLNNGMYQFSEVMHLEKEGDGVPEKVLIDIHPLVDDQDELYPFINTREDIKKDIREEVTEYVKKNIARPGMEKRKNRIQELYDSMAPVKVSGTTRKSIVFDPGLRMTPAETHFFTNSPVTKQLIKAYDEIIKEILTSVGRQKWIDRLEGVGIVLDPTMHGVHIPNPSTKKSTILINPFIRIGEAMSPRDAAWDNTITNMHEVAHVGNESGAAIRLTDDDLADPRVGKFLADYMNHIIKHGDTSMWLDTGHGMGFAHRLGEVYANFGINATFTAAARLQNIFTGGNKSGGYSPEIQELLRIYEESRGRDATTEDLLSPTGIKQANNGPDRTGGFSGDNSTDGIGVSERGGIGDETGSVNVGDIGKAWKAVKRGTGWGQGQSKTPEQAEQEKFNVFREIWNFPDAATTTGDLSFPGRQGLPLIITPEFWKGFVLQFGGAWSKKAFDEIHKKILSEPEFRRPIDPNTGLRGKSTMDQIGFRLKDVATGTGPREEATVSRYLEDGAMFGPKTIGGIPNPLRAAWRYGPGVPIRMSNRAFVTYANVLRANRLIKLMRLARDMSGKALATGRGPMPGILGGPRIPFTNTRVGLRQNYSPGEALDLNPYNNIVLGREMVDFINTVTGTAPLKFHALPFKQAEVPLEKLSKALSLGLFSPRLAMSRIRMLNPNTYVMASPMMRKEYLKAALSMAAAWYIFAELLKWGVSDSDDATINNNATSADFGKVRIGDTRLDPGASFIQFLVAYAKLYQGGATSSATGEYHRFGSGYQAETQESSGERFVVNKMKPIPKFIYDLANATEYQPFHVYDRTMQLVIPLMWQDLYELSQERPDLLPKLAAPVLFGGGTQTYEKGESVGKFIAPENDWLVTGGGPRDLMPESIQNFTDKWILGDDAP